LETFGIHIIKGNGEKYEEDGKLASWFIFCSVNERPLAAGKNTHG